MGGLPPGRRMLRFGRCAAGPARAESGTAWGSTERGVFPATGRGVAWGISGGPSGPKTAIQVNQRINLYTSRFTRARLLGHVCLSDTSLACTRSSWDCRVARSPSSALCRRWRSYSTQRLLRARSPCLLDLTAPADHARFMWRGEGGGTKRGRGVGGTSER